MLFPIYAVMNASIKTTEDLYKAPFKLTNEPQFKNYIEAWVRGNLGIYFKNSIIVTFASQIFVVIFSSMGAFALTRSETFKKFDRFIYILFLFGITLPPHVAIIPLYLQMNRLNLINSLVGLIIIFVAIDIPFGVFIMYSFFNKIPKEIEDAAKIDGCSNIGLYTRIVMPLSRSAVTIVIIFSCVWIWNNFLFPLVFISDNNLKTLPIGLLAFRGKFLSDYTVMFAGVVLVSIPIVIVYLLLQNQFMSGITAGSIKE